MMRYLRVEEARGFPAPGPKMSKIASMPLYVDVGRIHAELADLGLTPHGPLRPDQLYPFDQLHYHGVAAVRDAASRLGLGAGSRVLDVGSGLGGPARCLAHEFGCRVTALELQPALHQVAVELTSRCGLDGRVQHVLGDALDVTLPPARFDAAVSWMVVHHVPQRPRLLARLAGWLKPRGTLYIEDLFARASFSDAEVRDVERLLFGKSLTDRGAYEVDLRADGFVDVEWADKTEDWGSFCAERASAFRGGRDRYVRVHGQAAFDLLDDFFSGVAKLFSGGHLGGVGITAMARGQK